MSTSVLPIIIAATAAAERRMLEALQRAGATAPDRAVPESALDLGSAERSALARYRVKHLVREGDGGGLWLDEAALEAWRAAQRTAGRRVVFVLLGVTLVALAVVLVLRVVMQAEPPRPPI